MKRLGEILIEHGSLTKKQLDEALKKQKTEKKGMLLGELLIEMGAVNEQDIVIALATQFNVPYLPIGNITFSDEATSYIPQEHMTKHLCVPVDRIGSLMTVVMADPTNMTAIKEIESVTKCKLQTFVASATEITTAMKQHFGISSNESVAGSKESFRTAVKQKSKESK
jgi:type IV pilus assembly protein PilB